MSAQDLSAASALKAKGNAAFAAGDAASAIAAWEAAAAKLPYGGGPTGGDARAVALANACRLNAALAHTQVGGPAAWAAAEEAASAVLLVCPGHAKALLRRGSARMAVAAGLAAREKAALLPTAKVKARTAVEDLTEALAGAPDVDKAVVRAKLEEARRVQAAVEAAAAAGGEGGGGSGGVAAA